MRALSLSHSKLIYFLYCTYKSLIHNDPGGLEILQGPFPICLGIWLFLPVSFSQINMINC
uniref:Uncharacterized protein n=1 Tax=Rhinopithecus roxellana TaxID=61622 RepID=A0A2K6PYU9_RHIRO